MGLFASQQAGSAHGGLTINMRPASGLLGVSSSLTAQSEHPDFPHLVLLVFEAVLEVVCVSLPGYIVARMGGFTAEQQKFVANLNLQLFTPCLIFTKLASQLDAHKLLELAIIPVIFLLQIGVSYIGSALMSRFFGFGKQARNFVTAMAVFGNSNSLPISLVLSLSQTISGLHWDRVPDDDDDQVSSRGILYLMIFQQLGQLLRWSWGYQILLAPPSTYTENNAEDDLVGSRGINGRMEEGRYRDINDDGSQQPLLDEYSDNESSSSDTITRNQSGTLDQSSYKSRSSSTGKLIDTSSGATSSASTQVPTNSNGSKAHNCLRKVSNNKPLGPSRGDSRYITSFPESQNDEEETPGFKSRLLRLRRTASHHSYLAKDAADNAMERFLARLPVPIRKVIVASFTIFKRFLRGTWEFMNPPLWAMLAAIFVATIPALQRLFFTPGTFVNNSVSHAIAQNAGVAVPLILVVLGGNLARSTPPPEEMPEDHDPKLDRNLLIASLLSRMLFPLIIMTPILALTAKYVPISILDDPIFIVVAFLLTGAPSALQLAQICQLNNVYLGAVSKLLFQSYVIWYLNPVFLASPPYWILPSTLILVTVALEVVSWAAD